MSLHNHKKIQEDYWVNDFPKLLDLNRRKIDTTDFEIELVKKYDESYGTLMFQPSCRKLRMSPISPCCSYFVDGGYKSEPFCQKMTMNYNVSSVKIPTECSFSVLNTEG